MINFLLAEGVNIFDEMLGVFSKIGEFIKFDYILLGALAVMVLVLICSLIAARNSYEFRLLRSVSKLNRYFAKTPYITDENLVTVNNMMKGVPYVPRYCWQEYMLNRDKFPSDYMSSVSCIDQPIKTSSYNVTTRVTKITTVIVAFISLFLNFLPIYFRLSAPTSGTNVEVLIDLFRLLITPIFVLLIGYIFVSILNLYQPKTIKDLYTTYHEFERYINKACSTMPSFVDYEILFTPKEIAKGIPVLQEYLEKRAIQEQKEAEEAQINSVKFENFNFNELGVENSLLLERAMKESEKYFNIKKNLTERTTSKEQELYNFQKKFDEVTKEFERKAQASRENLAQINEQMNNTTIKIEVNYQKKRYNEEQQRLQQLEKDYEQAQLRFKKQQEEIVDEVNKFNSEIASRKKTVEDAMASEGKAYANKVFGQINKAVFAQNEPIMKEIQDEKGRLEQMVEDMNATIEKQNLEIEDRNDKLKLLEKDLNVKLAEIEAINNVKQFFSSAQFRKNMNDLRKKGVIGDDDSDEGMSLIDVNKNAHDIVTKTRNENIANSLINDIDIEEKKSVDLPKDMKKAKNVEINEQSDDMDFSEINDVQNQINQANQEYLNNKEDLHQTIDKTINSLDGKIIVDNTDKNNLNDDKKGQNTNSLFDNEKNLFRNVDDSKNTDKNNIIDKNNMINEEYPNDDDNNNYTYVGDSTKVDNNQKLNNLASQNNDDKIVVHFDNNENNTNKNQQNTKNLSRLNGLLSASQKIKK